jgi:Xaa-Pro aminopeptidase
MADDLVRGTAAALAELGLENARVGFDDLRLAQHVKAELSGLQVADAIDAWLDIRKVKTAQEIEFLRHGAAINEAGLRDIMPRIRPGAVWKDIAAQFRNLSRHAAPTCYPRKKPCSSAPSMAASIFQT